MTTQQSEAERLSEALERAIKQTDSEDDVIHVARWFVEDSAAELRRLHDLTERMNSAGIEQEGELVALKKINAMLLESLEFPANLDLSGAEDRAKSLILDVVVYKARAAIAAAKLQERS